MADKSSTGDALQIALCVSATVVVVHCLAAVVDMFQLMEFQEDERNSDADFIQKTR